MGMEEPEHRLVRIPTHVARTIEHAIRTHPELGHTDLDDAMTSLGRRFAHAVEWEQARFHPYRVPLPPARTFDPLAREEA